MSRSIWEAARERRLAHLDAELAQVDRALADVPLDDDDLFEAIATDRDTLVRERSAVYQETYDDALADHRYDEWKARREDER